MKLDFSRLAPKIALGSAFSVAITAITFAMPPQDYDIAAAKKKLKRIYAAVKLYRKEHGFKAPEDRHSAEDAGLPDGIDLFDPANKHKPWYLSPTETQVATPVELLRRSKVHYLILWPNSDHSDKTLMDFYSKRGEDMPIIADINMNSDFDSTKNRRIHALILRLNGKIEKTTLEWSTNFPRCFLEK